MKTNEEVRKIVNVDIINQLETWIETSEMTAKIFRKEGLDKEAKTFVDYAQAYWNVKQLIEVNGV
tara:strand:+ start:518 stop:712 length:195 start_codon:yes stop_codon:yes gene_type:complete